MKQLELELKKRFLIVEFDENCELQTIQEKLIVYYDTKKGMLGIPLDYDIKFICKASELTEEIAKELVHQSIHTYLFAYYVKDIQVNTFCYREALESFASAIESNGYYLGENPMRKPEYDIEWYGRSSDEFDRYENDVQVWYNFEDITLNPEKTLIFEIL